MSERDHRGHDPENYLKSYNQTCPLCGNDVAELASHIRHNHE